MKSKSIGEVTVEVKPVLTVDDDTAYTCLMLLELYCKANDKVLEVCQLDCQSYNIVDMQALKQMGE